MRAGRTRDERRDQLSTNAASRTPASQSGSKAPPPPDEATGAVTVTVALVVF